MKFYKVFDSSNFYKGFWTENLDQAIIDWEQDFDPDKYQIGDEMEVRCFDTHDINMLAYDGMNDDDYFDYTLSKVVKKMVYTEKQLPEENAPLDFVYSGEIYADWEEIKDF